jgi:hypothetical protein
MLSGPSLVIGGSARSGPKTQGIFVFKIRNIKIFGYAVIFNFFLRIVMYIICGAVMHGFVPNYMNITQQELNSKDMAKNRYYLQRPLP